MLLMLSIISSRAMDYCYGLIIIVGILTFVCRKNSILGFPEPKKAELLDIFVLMSIQNSMLS